LAAPEEKARAAAEELAAYETRFAKIETDLAVIKWMLVIAGVGAQPAAPAETHAAEAIATVACVGSTTNRRS
jgi:hypothetical protein